MTQYTEHTARLTAYQLACGAVQRRMVNNYTVSITLWLEHGTYHVRAFDWHKLERVFWYSFRTLTEARKAYRRGVA